MPDDGCYGLDASPSPFRFFSEDYLIAPLDYAANDISCIQKKITSHHIRLTAAPILSSAR